MPVGVALKEARFDGTLRSPHQEIPRFI
jgi:hypothetical protein